MVEIALSVLPTTNRDDYPRGSKRRLAAACRPASLPESTLRLPRQRLRSMALIESQDSRTASLLSTEKRNRHGRSDCRKFGGLGLLEPARFVDRPRSGRPT
jgi:hypothetical protein